MDDLPREKTGKFRQVVLWMVSGAVASKISQNKKEGYTKKQLTEEEKMKITERLANAKRKAQTKDSI